MTTLTKAQVAQRLAEIKALSEALSTEEKSLRAQLAVGDKITGTFGSVSMIEQTRTSYDESLYQDLLVLGVDPTLVGKVKITPTKEKVASLVATTPEVQVALDKCKVATKVPVVRIKPDATIVHNARIKVANMANGS
tara:strand:- start:38 stop:448 length:411 start_codon:yes stop_codon:yes gene_type:complete